MARNRNQRVGMVEACKKKIRQYPCVATYLTYMAAPYALNFLDLGEYAGDVPYRSAFVALIADAAEGAGLFPTAARLVLGAVGVYNGLSAINDVQNFELVRAGLEGWLAYTTFRDALVRHSTVE